MSDPLRFSKDVGGPIGPGSDDPDETLPVIVKVNEPRYVPNGFEVRTWIDDLLYTAEASRADVDAADADPNVHSIDRSRRLR